MGPGRAAVLSQASVETAYATVRARPCMMGPVTWIIALLCKSLDARVCAMGPDRVFDVQLQAAVLRWTRSDFEDAGRSREGAVMCKQILITSVVFVGMTQQVRAATGYVVLPPGQPIFSCPHDPEWKEIKDLAGTPGRVFATENWWTGGYTYRTAYFRGDVVALNKMIKLCASLPSSQPRKHVGHILIRDDGAEVREMIRKSYGAVLRV